MYVYIIHVKFNVKGEMARLVQENSENVILLKSVGGRMSKILTMSRDLIC